MVKGPDGKMNKMLVANGINKRAQVMNGTAYKTSHGAKGLKRSDLMMKNGRIVSRKASKSAGKNKNLGKLEILDKIQVLMLQKRCQWYFLLMILIRMDVPNRFWVCIIIPNFIQWFS